MDAILYSLITLATQWTRPRDNARMQLLEAQIRMLRSRVDTSRIMPTPAERAELIRLGAAMDHKIGEVMHVVLPATYKNWLRKLRGARPFRPLGRPRTPFAKRRLVLRLATENLRWGYRRIVREFKKLGIRIGATTIRDILKEERHFPDPQKATKKREVLNHFFRFSRGELDYILRVWLNHYHEQRPHRGVGRDNIVLDENFVPNTEGRVHCKTELGGILKSYYREAA